VKATNFTCNDWLDGKLVSYARENGIPKVGAMRMILSQFFRNLIVMGKDTELPEGIFDLGEGKGYMIDMEKLRDQDGIVHPPPPNLTKAQTLEWILKYHNGKKENA
jgi:hypothetical protein